MRDVTRRRMKNRAIDRASAYNPTPREDDAMKAMLTSGSPEGFAAARTRQSAQRRATGRGAREDAAHDLAARAPALADAPRTVAQRQQMHDAFGPAIQRAGLEEEVPLQGKLLQPVQRAGLEEEVPLQGKLQPAQREALEEEPMQGKFAPIQRAAEGAHDSAAPNRTGMPDHLKAGVESLSGLSLDNVSVHYNSEQPAQLNALAYAQGTDIHVAPGQEQHLPHEAWHVVQQAQGRVQPTMQLNAGVPVNDDAGLEREADVMGGRAADMDPFGSSQRAR
jgi:hypothetical protein